MLKNSLPRGFSLIELLVSIAIIAVLSAASMSLLGQGSRQSARDSRRMADLSNLSGVLEIFRNDNGGYPQCSSGTPTCVHTNILGVSPNYISSLSNINDPVSSSGRRYYYSPLDASGSTCSGAETCTRYYLCAAGEKTTTAASGCPATCGGTFTCSLVVSSL